MDENRFSAQLTSAALIVLVIGTALAATLGNNTLAPPVHTVSQVVDPVPTPTATPTMTPIILPPPVLFTFTSLTTSPTSPVGVGTAVTLKSLTTGPAGSRPPPGTVQFKDGGTNLGVPVPTTVGMASITTSTLAVGTHELTAVFVPADRTAFATSVSPPVTFVVNPTTGAKDTKTTLLVFPAGPSSKSIPRLLLARVEPSGAAGTVQFKDGTTTLEAPAPVIDGFAVIIITQLTVGTHPLTAMFIPADPATFTPSTSNTVRVKVRPGDDDGNR